MRAPAALALLVLLLAGCSDSGDDGASDAGDGAGAADGAPSDASGTATGPGARPAPSPSTPAAPCSPRTHEVVMRSNLFEPQDLTVCQGDTVHWTTEDVQAHNVVSDSAAAKFRSQDISVIPVVYAQDFSHTFTAAGTVDYVCEYHSGMVGTITVTPA